MPVRLALVFLCGCSLLGLDDFELAMCGTQADCEPLNVEAGISPESCSRYRCSLGGACVFRENDLDGDGEAGVSCGGADCNDDDARISSMANEVCDGLDNDCDEVSDEGVGELVETTLHRSADPVASVGYASNLVAWSTSAESGWLGSETPAPLSYAREANESNLMQPQLVVEDECPFPVEGSAMGIRCNFKEVDVAPASGSALFTAIVHDRGCPEGQLRIGRIDQLDPPRVVLRGPQVRSNLHFGVDVDWTDRPCTGASRASDALGAARPTLASAGDRALAFWLADSLERDACDASLVDLEAIEVLEESGPSGGETVYWVTGSNDGVPQTIGQTRGQAGAAAIESGYAVAYGNAEGVALHVVPHIARPAPVAIGADPDASRPVEPLDLGAAPFVLPAESEEVFDVRVAGQDDRVALLWREGCRMGRLMLAIVMLDDFEIVLRQEIDTDVDQLAISALGRGWAVAWTAASTVRLLRLDSMGTDIDPEPLRLATSVRNTSNISVESSTVTFVAGDGQTIQRAELSCPGADEDV